MPRKPSHLTLTSTLASHPEIIPWMVNLRFHFMFLSYTPFPFRWLGLLSLSLQTVGCSVSSLAASENKIFIV